MPDRRRRGRDPLTALGRRLRNALSRGRGRSAAPSLRDRLRPPPTLRTAGPGGPVLVAVPGLGLSVLGWRPTLAALAPHAGGLALALPAFGAPAAARMPLGPGSSAGRLVARLDAAGPGRVVLLGHSASCQVVAEAAALRPERVAALVLVGPTTDPAGASRSALALRWARTVARERHLPVSLLVRDYTHSGIVGFVRAMGASRRHRLDRTLRSIACPVLLVRGTHDHICPAGWLERLAGSTGAGVLAPPTAGAHMVPLTHPRELADRIRDFLPSREVAG